MVFANNLKIINFHDNMTTREQKIDVINKVIANKELSFGCRVKHKFIQNQIITIQDYKLNNYIYWIKD